MSNANNVWPAFPCEIDPAQIEVGAHQTGKRADFGSRKQGSAADRILELMVDGAVWDSTRLIEQLDLDRSTVNGALRHLVQRNMISHVGVDHETPRGKKLYRIKARTC